MAEFTDLESVGNIFLGSHCLHNFYSKGKPFSLFEFRFSCLLVSHHLSLEYVNRINDWVFQIKTSVFLEGGELVVLNSSMVNIWVGGRR